MIERLGQELVTRKEKLETRNELTSLEIQLRALEIAAGLTSTEAPNDMTGWYCLAYKKLGEGRYEACAKMARKGNSPSRLFGWLIKQELKKVLEQ